MVVGDRADDRSHANETKQELYSIKNCLVKSQNDKSVDCSEFRTALQVIEAKKRIPQAEEADCEKQERS